VNQYILVQPAAQKDLEDIGDYLFQRSIAAADRFSYRAAESFNILLSNPTLGSSFDIPNPALRGLRAWPMKGFRNYLIFYRSQDCGIEILRVVHGARDIEKIFED